ncbi:YHYH protein [Muricauda sp. SCSIO 64092]|uniref:YHYH protein n=1 Tax=Allomuricauda sp. SCSIO 64092 TaxID=2908842 RepID=UPI001FF3AC26|nr:YHYH protein [Muricauda sp. SCSIO 64092]UOY07041.1 YHYH protein [Muricauda sp. SCSIO 64092]
MRILKNFLLLYLFLLASCSTSDDSEITLADNGSNLDCSGSSNVFTINLDASGCTVDIASELGGTSLYSESISGNTRSITVNGVANHLVGQFPNSGNPNTIAPVSETYSMNVTPQLANATTDGAGYTTGVLFSGVVIEPYTAEFFIGSDGTINREWNITTLQSTTPLGLDCNNAHVQPTGRYHYHGTPSNYIDGLNVNGTEMVKIGYAADGFPIYYKYVYDSDGVTLVALESGYQLKTEPRGGDGLSAPDGCPDGYYFQDYEYMDGSSTLDACNGRFGKTPEAEDEYYYVITDNFPSMPLCFSGTPNPSFSFRP